MRGVRMLHRGRAMADSLMQSTCIIRRASGPPVRDPETGTTGPSLVTIYEGPCRVRFGVGSPREVDQAGQRFAEQSPTVWLPVHASGIRVDDAGELTANPHAPEDVGTTFRIAGIHAQTHSTSRRFPVDTLNFA